MFLKQNRVLCVNYLMYPQNEINLQRNVVNFKKFIHSFVVVMNLYTIKIILSFLRT